MQQQQEKQFQIFSPNRECQEPWQTSQSNYFQTYSSQNIFSNNFTCETEPFQSSGRMRPLLDSPIVELLEIHTSNVLKAKRLISAFFSQDLSRRIQQFNESLGFQEAIQLFYKIEEIIKNIVANQQEEFSLLVYFQHSLFDFLPSLMRSSQMSPRSITSLNNCSPVNLDVVKTSLLLNLEQLYGSQGRLAEIYQIQQDIYHQNLSEQAISNFKRDFNINLQIHISSVRYSLLQSFLGFSLNRQQLLQSALKLSVSIIQSNETSVFQVLRSNLKPSLNDIRNLILYYFLLSEQLQLAEKMKMSQFACEVLGKSADSTQIVEIRKGFLKNGIKFAQKYLSEDESSILLCEKIRSAHKKIGLDYSIYNYQKNRQEIKITEGMAFLLIFYDLKYLVVLTDSQLQIQSLTSFHLIDLVYDKINQSSRKQSQNQNQLKQRSQTNFQSGYLVNQKQYKPVQKKKEFIVQKQQSEPAIVKAHNDECQNLLKELKLHKTELVNLKTQYHKELNQQKLESSNQVSQPLYQFCQINQVDKLQFKIDSLESNLANLRNENIKNKKQKDFKESEVSELKIHIADLQVKQKKLEKMIQLQTAQTMPSNNQDSEQNTFTIPRRQESLGPESKSVNQNLQEIQLECF